MKKYILAIVALLFISSGSLNAQDRTLKQVMELKMPKTADTLLWGTRGAGVCWNPVTKKYYAAFAGNKGFPMAVFSATGKRVSDDDLTTMEDIRGLWYNPVTKTMMTNGYDDKGWFYYTLDKAGIPTEITNTFTDMNQPDAQSVGCYDTRSKYVCFLNKSRILFYKNVDDMFAITQDSVQIHWGRTKSQGPGEDENELDENPDYNFTNVVATGIAKSEFGVLNTLDKQIELYDSNEGYLMQTLKLPKTAPVESMFNFAFSNGIYWLFDIKNRKWIGYK